MAGRRASPAEGKATQNRAVGTQGGVRRDCATCMRLRGWRDLKTQTGLTSSDRCTPGLVGALPRVPNSEQGVGPTNEHADALTANEQKYEYELRTRILTRNIGIHGGLNENYQ